MKKTKQVSPSDALIDEWLKQGRKPEDVQGLLRQITKQVVERAMQGEMAEHLGYEKHDPDAKQPKRDDAEDAERRFRRGGNRDAARPQRRV